MDPGVAKQGGEIIQLRDYRKGNWTIEETMVLIEAKKMDDERRTKRLGDGGERGKPAELRWKWVEDYCWRRGCFRSQNQCNDKWDNLMRDFKKVREYERRAAEIGGGGGGGQKSYWRIEKNERKEKNLPSNMLPQIYEALVAVTERKGQRVLTAGCGGAGSSREAASTFEEKSSGHHVAGLHSLMLPSLRQPPLMPGLTLLPPVPQQAQTTAEPPPVPLPTVGGESSDEYSGSPSKRRKKSGGGEGTSGTTSGDVGSAIWKGASTIAEAIERSEERGERRHREMVSLEERRLQVEESKAEINRQGVHSLAEAINKLANSILALASHTNRQP